MDVLKTFSMAVVTGMGFGLGVKLFSLAEQMAAGARRRWQR